MTPDPIAEERSRRLRAAFLNHDFGDAGKVLESAEFGNVVEDKQTFLMSSAVAGWAGSALGRRVNPASPDWQGIKDGIARGFFKNQAASNVSDQDLFSMIAADYQAQDKIAQMARQAASRGESWLGKFRELEGAEAGNILPGRLPNYLGLARAAHDEMRDKVAPYRQTINTVAEMARNIDTDPEGADWGKMAAELVKVPKQDRAYVLEALSLQSPTANKPEDMERVKLSFLRGMERFLDTAATGSYEVLQSAGQYSEIPLAPETPEETATRKQRESEAADYRDLRDDMRKIATGNLAPLEAVRVAGMNIAGAAEMVPMTLGAFVPYVGPAAILGSIQRETYNQLRDANPTMSREDAQSIATIAAPFQAITEVVSDRLLLGRLPNLKRAFSLPVFSAAGLAGQMSGRVALGAGVEMTEELVQGMTPLAIQSTIAALERDVPNADWKSFFGDFAQNAPELLSQVLPLALVGAGVGQLSDYRAGKALARSPDLLVAARYTPEQAAQISEAANKGDWATAESVMRTSWAEINAKAASPAEVEANAQARVAAAERIKAIQDEQAKTQAIADTEGADYVSQVVRTPSGWEIRTGDGQVIPASSLEAAQRINADLKQTASVEEAEALVQVIDDWHLTKAAEQAETKLTGENVTGTSAGVFGLRDGKTRAFDAKALETIRQQAENIGIATDTQDVFAHVNGSNEVYPSRVAKDAKEIVKRLNLFQSQKGGQPQVITFLHEAIESSFQLGMAKGVFNEADTRKAFAALAPALDPKRAKTDEERRLYEHVVQLSRGEGDATMLRETVSELAVRDVIGRDRKNQRTGLRSGSISRAIEAAVMGAKTAQEANIYKRFRALLKAFSAYLRGVLSTVRQIKQAKDKGTIGEDWNAFVDKVLGLDEVTELEKQAIQEAQEITAAGNMAFSVSPIKSLDELSDAIQQQMSTKPAEKLRVWSQVQRNLQRLRDNWSKDRWTWKGDRIRPISEKRTKASLDAEQAMLQARLEGEKLAANMEASQALKEAKAEAQAWRDEADAMQAEDWNPRASLIRDLVTLEAMIATLPKEIRGQVGGFVALARKGTEKARLAELQKRVEKMGVLLEKHLKEEYGDAVDKLFDKYRPEREAGKKAKGKLDPDAQEISDAAEAATDFTPDQTSAELAKIDTLLGAENITPEEETKLETMRELVQLMGDWKNADSARRESAFLALRDTLEEGWAKWKLKQLQKREEREEQRKTLRTSTKRKGTGIQRDQMGKESAKVLGKANRWLLNLSSFSDVVRYIFGDAKEATALVERERDASSAYEDAIQSMSEHVDEFFTALGNGVLRGEQMRFDMSQPSITVGTTEFNKRELSELQGIQALLIWQQEDGKRHMEGPRDENNKPIEGKWAYDQAWIDELTSKLSPEAMQVKQFLETLYGAEYQSLNALYRERHGVNLPRHDRYAPITVKPQQAKQGEMVDPVSGAAVSGSILTPGALRSRNRSAVAEPQFRDALTTFIAHTKQMEHWKAYYDFAIDAQAVLGNREVMNAVEASVGTEGVSVLRKWVDAFAQGGTRDAAAGLEIYQGLSRLASRAAVVGLLGRLSTILVQSTQLAAASVKMPVGAYLKRLGLLLSGNLEWSDAMNSEFIQRRIKTAPPIVQQAMRALGDAKRPNQITRAVRFLGNLLSGADGLFTSGTYAILLDYHRTMGRKMGLEGAELEAHAHREAVTATEQVAQPVRAGTRSLAEITNTSPLAKMSWAYASEARQKMALFAWSAKQAKADPAGFVKTSFLVFVVGGLMSQILKNLWREAKGDDDEKKWSSARLTQSMFSPITGAIPGLNMLMGEGGQLSGAKYAQYAVEDLFDGEADMKDIDTILSVMGYFNDTAAGIAALSHAGYDFAQVLDNAFGEE